MYDQSFRGRQIFFMRMTQSTSLHRDQISGDLIPVSQVNIPAREMAMLANLLLIILGILEVLFTLPSFIICLREICYCYSDSEVLMAAAAVAGSAEQERGLKELFLHYLLNLFSEDNANIATCFWQCSNEGRNFAFCR